MNLGTSNLGNLGNAENAGKCGEMRGQTGRSPPFCKEPLSGLRRLMLLLAVQPRISTVRWKVLSFFVLPCYPLPWFACAPPRSRRPPKVRSYSAPSALRGSDLQSRYPFAFNFRTSAPRSQIPYFVHFLATLHPHCFPRAPTWSGSLATEATPHPPPPFFGKM